ncbi:hypothetical protein FB567DRAFT_350104 [Paraphoma chrysanthemicola]|uniref:Uncharacterized protein n=1 Tax=Paraphoma chrysanthemicola TaxID=798071 RepID=A0A8K0VYA3_9PLEO|nr:hypothetical protein FB567DRAFT_350104 [Paraphoma chrysanthemicola]
MIHGGIDAIFSWAVKPIASMLPMLFSPLDYPFLKGFYSDLLYHNHEIITSERPVELSLSQLLDPSKRKMMDLPKLPSTFTSGKVAMVNTMVTCFRSPSSLVTSHTSTLPRLLISTLRLHRQVRQHPDFYAKYFHFLMLFSISCGPCHSSGSHFRRCTRNAWHHDASSLSRTRLPYNFSSVATNGSFTATQERGSSDLHVSMSLWVHFLCSRLRHPVCPPLLPTPYTFRFHTFRHSVMLVHDLCSFVVAPRQCHSASRAYLAGLPKCTSGTLSTTACSR